MYDPTIIGWQIIIIANGTQERPGHTTSADLDFVALSWLRLGTFLSETS